MSDGRADADLVSRCRDGDDRAFEQLVRQYQQPLYHLALRMVRDPEDARDLAQTIFLKAYRQLDSFDLSQRFFSWLYRIGVNECLNFLRRTQREEQLATDGRSEAADPERLSSSRELERLVQAALMTLQPDYRVVLVLRHFGECSYEEIARIVGVPEKTVKSRLFSARQLLRERLERQGVLP